MKILQRLVCYTVTKEYEEDEEIADYSKCMKTLKIINCRIQSGALNPIISALGVRCCLRRLCLAKAGIDDRNSSSIANILSKNEP